MIWYDGRGKEMREMGGGRSLMARDSVLAGPTGCGFRLTLSRNIRPKGSS